MKPGEPNPDPKRIQENPPKDNPPRLPPNSYSTNVCSFDAGNLNGLYDR